MKQELCMNIWFIVDIGSDLCYQWSARAYNLAGGEDEKLKLLNTLADSDYLTAPRFEIPKENIVVYDNEELRGRCSLNAISDLFDLNFEYFVTKLEDTLPPLYRFSGDFLPDNKAEPQKFSDAPLFKMCLVGENEFGEMRAMTSEENQKWYEDEKARIEAEIRMRKN
jgi:hypothetical protein